MKKSIKVWGLPILSGLFIGTSYIPFPPWAVLICYVPLMMFWSKQSSMKRIFWGGWITQFILSLIGFHWIAYTTVEFGHLPWIVGGLALFAFAAAMHLHIPIAGVLWFYLNRKFQFKTSTSLIVMATALIAVETSYPMIFPWHLGYTFLAAKLPIYQFADIIGFEGLSYIVFLSCAAVTTIFLENSKIKQRAVRIGVLLAIFVALQGAGKSYETLRRNQFEEKSPQTLNALVIQANIGNYEKYLAERIADIRTPILETYERITRKAVETYPESDLVVWPETAFADNLDVPYQRGFHQMRIIQLIKDMKKPFIVGAYSQDFGTRTSYNALFSIGALGETAGVYRKRHLLAFGEYVPGGEHFPFLKKLIPEISDFGRGKSPSVFGASSFKFGAQVCYEGLFPPLSAELAAAGAQVFVNASNDSWYGNRFEPYQHMYMTLARAIEFRRPLIRATNTGFSTVVSSFGDIQTLSTQDQEWFGVYKITVHSEQSATIFQHLAPYTKWIFWLLLAIFTGVFRNGPISKSRLD